MEAGVFILIVLFGPVLAVTRSVSSYGELYDRLYRHSGNFPAVRGP